MCVFADLSGRTIVVTGGTSGIGRAIALEVATAGANILVHGTREPSAAVDICEAIRRQGRQCWYERCDFRQQDTWVDFVSRVYDRCGPVHGWVNGAGVDLLTGTGSQWDYGTKLRALLDVDVAATVQLSKIVGERMRVAGSGVILNIGWDQADRGMEGDSAELFSVAKNAVMGFTRSLAVSLAPQVRVNCIAPGWIKTAWGERASDDWQQRVLRETPLNRWGTPEDIAKLARFLLSDDASYITGQIINANGGAVR
ncbi:MAG TPA: SDR family oxidoreductase [Planctomycetaceae bacterium]|nr:SDR family oxidoreductase [Planctomycetaceae bacterium]